MVAVLLEAVSPISPRPPDRDSLLELTDSIHQSHPANPVRLLMSNRMGSTSHTSMASGSTGDYFTEPSA